VRSGTGVRSAGSAKQTWWLVEHCGARRSHGQLGRSLRANRPAGSRKRAHSPSMSGCWTAGAGASASDEIEPEGTGPAATAARTEAVTTQYRKMSVSDGMPAGHATLSDGALPELMPTPQTDVACLASNAETSVQLGDAAMQRMNYVDAIKFYTHALTPNESSVEVSSAHAHALGNAAASASLTRERVRRFCASERTPWFASPNIPADGLRHSWTRT
jgi:hypothetical protein